MFSTNAIYSEEDRKRMMVNSDKPRIASNSCDPNAMDDS